MQASEETALLPPPGQRAEPVPQTASNDDDQRKDERAARPIAFDKLTRYFAFAPHPSIPATVAVSAAACVLLGAFWPLFLHVFALEQTPLLTIGIVWLSMHTLTWLVHVRSGKLDASIAAVVAAGVPPKLLRSVGARVASVGSTAFLGVTLVLLHAVLFLQRSADVQAFIAAPYGGWLFALYLVSTLYTVFVFGISMAWQAWLESTAVLLLRRLHTRIAPEPSAVTPAAAFQLHDHATAVLTAASQLLSVPLLLALAGTGALAGVVATADVKDMPWLSLVYLMFFAALTIESCAKIAAAAQRTRDAASMLRQPRADTQADLDEWTRFAAFAESSRLLSLRLGVLGDVRVSPALLYSALAVLILLAIRVVVFH